MKVDLLQGNITKSLSKLALPLMGMSFLQMAYNLTDVYWIGRLGDGPVASVGTGGLLLWLGMGIHMIAQLGSQVYVGQNLGAKDYQKASDYAYGGIILSLIVSLTLGFVYTFFNEQIVGFFGLNEASVVQDTQTYLRVTGGLVVFSLLAKLLTTLITVTGNSKTPLIATTLGLVFNMILDPMLIFGIGIFPEMGVLGAAIATVFAQFIVVSVLIFYVLGERQLFGHIKLRKIPSMDIFTSIIKLGFPATIQSVAYPLISMYISRMVATFGDSAVAVQRVGSQIESISWMTSDGFAVAINSFIAQNYGANNIQRAKEGFKSGLRIMLCVGSFSTLLLIFGAKPLFSIFLTDPATVAMGTSYLVILGVSQLFMCVEILSGSAMNAFGKSKIPATINIIFTGLRIPMAIVLSSTVLALDGIWWSITISSIFKGVILFIAVVYLFKKVIRHDV